MVKIFIVLILFTGTSHSIAQIKRIDTDAIKSWLRLETYEISNNGNYVWYRYGSEMIGSTLVLCDLKNGSTHKFDKVSYSKFADNNQYLIFIRNAELNILSLNGGARQTVNNVSPVGYYTTGNWISYNKNDTLYIRNLITGKEKEYILAKSLIFDKSGSLALLKFPNYLKLVDLINQTEKVLTYGHIGTISFDDDGHQVAFLVEKNDTLSIGYYHVGLKNGMYKSINPIVGLQDAYVALNSPLTFSQDGNYLFFNVKAKDGIQNKDSVITAQVDIWNYKDIFLQSQQIIDLSTYKDRTYQAVIATKFTNSKVIQIENDSFELSFPPGNKFAIRNNVFNRSELYWNNVKIPSYQLLSFKTNEICILPINGSCATNIMLSPNEMFVTWFDQYEGAYYSYEISSKKVTEIGADVKHFLVERTMNRTYPIHYGIGGWLKGDESLLIYDKYDSWKVDPRGRKKSCNINKYYGRNNNIEFRLVKSYNEGERKYINRSEILETGFHCDKKNNVFAKADLTQKRLSFFEPKIPGTYYNPIVSEYPIKRSKDKELFILSFQTDSFAPNVCVTTDFKTYNILSDIHPEKQYKWLTAELVNWNIDNNKLGTGILYKPSDFDSLKKYPVIFNYYEYRSYERYKFLAPALSSGELNIPWYVNNGYLVFVPDIFFRVGSTAEDILKTITSAVQILSRRCYIDTSKLGLQGHSFGGFETNLIIANSNLFAAAQESAGIVDPVSWYGDVGFGGRSHAAQYEVGQSNFGATPWDNVDVYLKNSPILKAKDISTPLLIMHNNLDDAVSFKQALQMFTALRRLCKPTWLLQYDGEDHTINQTDNKLDFTIRQQQFFDFYLKDAKKPVWMIESIPASQKGIRSGLSYSL
ncbi:alpha/beta hydrolase family protein [Chitinophaga rhizophila]|uniref:Prolyl oligopeptidase family serine peptidase n=1 Tax=Chitinophaga rhizophila TaxID=2866212 RepID=A0ABS7GKB5_9BACT|nr:prolyl oligopeptidase family serine peptidase [Chitinophaga rhizophila]MBW8688159.1 prolyl oligopeptidase family serine peptidase [Chitinophaga rhizophila]